MTDIYSIQRSTVNYCVKTLQPMPQAQATLTETRNLRQEHNINRAGGIASLKSKTRDNLGQTH